MVQSQLFGGGAAHLWTALAIGLGLFFALWHFAALRSRLPVAKALLLAGLRAAALFAVLALIAGPRVTRRTRHQVRQPISVAVDTSRSMGLRGGFEGTRLDRVTEFLRSGDFDGLAAGYLPTYYRFSGSLSNLEPEAFATLQADGPRTDTARALREAAGVGEPAAMVFFTDGGHGAGEGADALAAIPDVPVVIVGVGAGERNLDIEVASVEPPAIAFVGQPLQVGAVVRASGYAGRSVPLLLRKGEQVLVSRTIVLPPDGQELRTALEWTPPAPGSHPLTVELPVREGEQIPENNRVEMSIDVVRDKIRVLLVSGAPSWSYRFLRAALKGDPSLDVVSFIILRTGSDAVDVPQHELSLIPFPTQKIFLEELGNFDLLVFDNFAYQPYLPVLYLEKIEAFVRAGGGFWMLGGPLSYLGGRYQQTPLAALLPVTLPAISPPDGDFLDRPVKPRLTAAGKTHPFFQGLAGRDDHIPQVRGHNITGPARPDTIVLAETSLPNGESQPLVVLGRHGRGRVLSVLTDSLWNWAFSELGSANRAYLTFVRQAVRWSIGDPLLQPLRVEPDRSRVAPGDLIRARIRVLGEDFLPSAHPGLAVTLRGPDGGTRALLPVLEAPGVYRVEAQTAGEGGWEITAEASARGAIYARSTTTVSAAWPPEEYRNPGLNRAAVRTLLAGRRGVFLELGSAPATAQDLEKALDDLTARGPGERAETRPLAEMLPVFLGLLGLLATEWLIRRRAGLD